MEYAPASTHVNLAYIITDPDVLSTHPHFTPVAGSMTICGNPTYRIENADGTAVNSNTNGTLFYYDDTIRTLRISSTNIYSIGVYNLRIIGDVHTYCSANFTITATVTKHCTDMFIFPDTSMTDMTFRIF